MVVLFLRTWIYRLVYFYLQRFLVQVVGGFQNGHDLYAILWLHGHDLWCFVIGYRNPFSADQTLKNADLILASNVFAHSDKLKEMAECMFKLLGKKGTIVIEVQYLMNTLNDLTFDNIYHEHYNYWSLTSLINFFNHNIFNEILNKTIMIIG